MAVNIEAQVNKLTQNIQAELKPLTQDIEVELSSSIIYAFSPTATIQEL